MPLSVVVPLEIILLKLRALLDHSSRLRVLVTGYSRCGHFLEFLRDAPTSGSVVFLVEKK